MGHAHTKNLAAIPGVVLHSVVGRTEEEAADFAHSAGYQQCRGRPGSRIAITGY